MTEGEEIFFTHYVEYIDMRLRRFFIKILVAFTFLGLTVAAAVVYVNHVSKENQRALCAVKTDAERRIVQAEEYLKENPKGFPGLTTAVIRRGIENNQRTVEALKDVSCE